MQRHEKVNFAIPWRKFTASGSFATIKRWKQRPKTEHRKNLEPTQGSTNWALLLQQTLRLNPAKRLPNFKTNRKLASPKWINYRKGGLNWRVGGKRKNIEDAIRKSDQRINAKCEK